MLNTASKICKISGFLNQTGCQSRNKKHHSTETLNILVSDFLLNSMDNKKLSAIVLLDLLKAFDSIVHLLLLQKLTNIGVSCQALKWFRSYLSGRRQYVRIGSLVSDTLSMTHGVPHREHYCHHYYFASIQMICPEYPKYPVWNHSWTIPNYSCHLKLKMPPYKMTLN